MPWPGKLSCSHQPQRSANRSTTHTSLQRSHHPLCHNELCHISQLPPTRRKQISLEVVGPHANTSLHTNRANHQRPPSQPHPHPHSEHPYLSQLTVTPESDCLTY